MIPARVILVLNTNIAMAKLPNVVRKSRFV
jgi:hypothetical protein